jgi:outer membrane murein-binding lipoprotein Lpp
MRSLVRILVVGTAAVFGGCSQPQAADDPVGVLRTEVGQLKSRVDTLETEQVELKKEAQACRTELDLVHAEGDEPSVEDGSGSKKSRSSSSSGSRRSGSSGSSTDVRMPGDG